MSVDQNLVVKPAVAMTVHTAIPVNERGSDVLLEENDEELGVIDSVDMNLEDASKEPDNMESHGMRVAWILANIVAIVYLLTNPLVYSISHQFVSFFRATGCRGSSHVQDYTALKMLSRDNFEEEFWLRYDRDFIVLYWLEDSAAVLPAWYEFASQIKRQDLPISIAMIDCKNEEPLCSQMAITEYPTIRWHFAYSFHTHDYQGNQNVMPSKVVASYMDFAMSMLEASAKMNQVGELDDFRVKSVYDDDWGIVYLPNRDEFRILDDYFQDPVIMQNYAKGENWLSPVEDDDDGDDYYFEYESSEDELLGTILYQHDNDDEKKRLNEDLAGTLNFESTE